MDAVLPSVQPKARDILLLAEACRHAALHSTDPQTQNGALLVSRMGEIVMAANTMPPIELKPERFERPLKYFYIEHAERNVIYEAAKAGVSTDGATLYCPWFACADCARAIIQAGIKRVVGHVVPWLETPDRWKDSVKAADEMLDEAKIIRSYLDDELGVSFRFNGELLEL
ncbi:CMP deaminase [bacterium]|nr:CMP deaminase [bacterium]